MTTGLERDYDFRVLPLAALVPPSLPMRESMDDAKLRELEASIRQKGVQSPLGVYACGGRFFIIYGHRRFVAATNVGETAVPCRVHKDGAAREEDYKFTENYFREEVNPAEEAEYFADLLERKHAGNLETLCAEFGLTESFVNGRLDLLRGWPHVLAALKQKRLVLSVARELNKFRDEGWSKHYLAEALEQGANTATVRLWRMNNDRFLEQQRLQAAGLAAPTSPSEEAPLGNADVCAFCVTSGDNHELVYVKVHESCLKFQQRQQRAAMGAP